MKAAAVFPEARKLGIVADIPEPKLDGPADVKLRMLEVGICATDREIASFIFGTPPQGSDFLVLGHEALAEVVEAGPEVENLKPGDLVIPMVRRPCPDPACAGCRMNRPDFCASGAYLERGIMRMHGFMTEMLVDGARFMLRVPPSIRTAAVLVEPLTIAEKAFLQARSIQRRLPWNQADRELNAVVLGAGPVGLLGAMALRHQGYSVTVYSLEREPCTAADIVRGIGARYVSSQDHGVAQMAAGIGNIDLVYEATGSAKLAFAVLNVLGRNGVLILTGVPGPHGEELLDTGQVITSMVLNNQCLLGTVNAGSDAFALAIEDLESFCGKWPEAVSGLITGRFRLEEFVQPIRNPVGIKNIVEISR